MAARNPHHLFAAMEIDDVGQVVVRVNNREVFRLSGDADEVAIQRECEERGISGEVAILPTRSKDSRLVMGHKRTLLISEPEDIQFVRSIGAIPQEKVPEREPVEERRVREVRELLEAQMQQERQRHEDQLKAMEERMVRTHQEHGNRSLTEQQMQHFQAQVQKAEERINRLEADLQRERELSDQLKASHQQELKAMRDAHEQRVEDLRRQLEEERNGRQRDAARAAESRREAEDSVRRRFEDEAKRKDDALAAAEARMRALTDEMATMARQHASDTERLRTKLQDRVEKVEERLADERRDAQRKLDDLRDANANLRVELHLAEGTKGQGNETTELIRALSTSNAKDNPLLQDLLRAQFGIEPRSSDLPVKELLGLVKSVMDQGAVSRKPGGTTIGSPSVDSAARAEDDIWSDGEPVG